MHPDDQDQDPVDPFPAMLADIDQALAMAGQCARVIRGNYEAFLGEGFTEKQSLYLAIAQLHGTPGEPPSS